MFKTATPVWALILLTAPVTLPGEVRVSFAVPRDGRVSLALYDGGGRMVRTLLTGRPLARGEHTISWDGLDRYGHALPAGDYTWKLLATEGLRAEFITQVGQNTDPAWEKATGNHQSPNAAAVDATGLYRQGSVNEGGHWGVKTDLDGRTLWANNRNQADPWMGGGEALTLVNGRLFELMRDGTVYGSDAASGRVFTGSDTQPRPWNLRWQSYVAPAGTPDEARRRRSIEERPHDLADDAAKDAQVDAGVFAGQVRVRCELVADHRHQGHALRAAGDDHIAHAGHDLLAGGGDALQAAGAEAVDRLPGRRHRHAGAQRDDARHVHALLRLGEGAAQHDILHLVLVDAAALDDRVDHRGRQFIRPRRAQRALRGLPHRRPRGGNNDSITHVGSPYQSVARGEGRGAMCGQPVYPYPVHSPTVRLE